MKLRIPFHSRIERREEEDEREKMEEVVSSIKHETTISGRVGAKPFIPTITKNDVFQVLSGHEY